MTTSDEQYVPDEDEVRNLYVNHCDPAAVRDDDFNAEFDRFLAKVKRDAAREALDGLIAWHLDNATDLQTPTPIRRSIRAMAIEAQRYRDTRYPESEEV